MADKKKADKKADAPASKSGGGLMGLIGKIMGALALVSASVLIAGIYDIGHFGLREIVFGFAWAPLALFFAGGLAHVFLGGAKAPDIPADTEALNAKIDDVQQKAASRFSSIQNSLDMVMGKDYEALAEENRQLKEQLDAIHAAERAKVEEEMDLLRQRNVELEEQIKKWAVETVAKSVAQQAA
ncbi:hypothetical protein [Oricola sp.]|uniref:hypothetical protein n=1 Tax=Oricola sp. TaxID=1979950 RepID=UPI003BA88CC8